MIIKSIIVYQESNALIPQKEYLSSTNAKLSKRLREQN